MRRLRCVLGIAVLAASLAVSAHTRADDVVGDKATNSAPAAVEDLLVVPEIPAAAALDLVPGGFARPETLADFLIQNLSGVDFANGGGFRPGVATEIGLGHLGYRSWTFKKWRGLKPGKRWGHALLDSTRVSFATTHAPDDSASASSGTRAALGVRWTLYNDRDYRFWNKTRLEEIDTYCEPTDTTQLRPNARVESKEACERHLKKAYKRGAMLDMGLTVVTQKTTKWLVPTVPFYLAFNHQMDWLTWGAGAQANLRHLESAPDLRVGGRLDAEWKSIISGRASLYLAANAAQWSSSDTSLLTGLSLALEFKKVSILLGTTLDTTFQDFASDLEKMPLIISLGYGKMTVPFSL